MADQGKIIPDGAAGPAEVNALLGASITDLQERLAEFEQGRGSDKLTGLPNRRRLLDELERVAANADRYGTPAALLYIEVEELDLVGERHGALAADAALIHVARLVAGLIRSTDVAARIGRNAFALVLDHLDHNSAIETADRIARCVADSSIGSVELRPRVGIGVAAVLKGDGAEEVLQRAEQNLRRIRDAA